MRVEFATSREVDKLLERGLRVLRQNVLVLPAMKEKQYFELTPFHQVLVTFSVEYNADKLVTAETAVTAIEGLHRFFSEFGRVVDLNLEFLPVCVIVTFLRHASVVQLIEKSKTTKLNVQSG